jgi:hypothetical protein
MVELVRISQIVVSCDVKYNQSFIFGPCWTKPNRSSEERGKGIYLIFTQKKRTIRVWRFTSLVGRSYEVRLSAESCLYCFDWQMHTSSSMNDHHMNLELQMFRCRIEFLCGSKFCFEIHVEWSQVMWLLILHADRVTVLPGDGPGSPTLRASERPVVASQGENRLMHPIPSEYYRKIWPKGPKVE